MSATGQGGYIESRQLIFPAGKKFRFEMELYESDVADKIPFKITGIMTESDNLQLHNGIYSAIIDLSGSTSELTGSLSLQLPGACVIEIILVQEIKE